MKPGLWANIHAKRKRGEKMRKKGEKGAPTPDAIARAKATSESTIRDNRPDHEIMHGAHGDARRKHDAVHGHGSYHKLPADQKIKLHRKEIDQRFADRGRKPPKYTVKHTGNKVGHVGSFEIHHTPLQKVRDRLRTPTKVSEEAPATNTTSKGEGTDRPNIWDNIRKRRAAGKPRLKPGEKGYPKTLDLPEEAPATNTASIPNPADTAMGPKFKTTTTQDKRKKKRPAVLKRFAKFIEPQND